MINRIYPMEIHDDIVAKYKQIDDKLFMTLDETIVLSLEISRQIKNRYPHPEIIFGIANGALMMSKVIADNLDLPMIILNIRRKGSGIKRIVSKVPGMRAIFSLVYRMPFFNLPLKFAMRLFEGLKKTDIHQESFNVDGKVVALVDDCIETGQTIALARETLLSAGAKQVVTCCISWSRLLDSVEKYEVEPDIYISRRVQHYPWSGNSPYWEDWMTWLADHDIRTIES